MNYHRRKELNTLADRLRDLHTDVETVRDEEQEYIDYMPENLQGGERYEKAEAAVYVMEEALSQIEEAISNIEEATE